MTTVDIADVLERAADDIATNGLAKGELLNEDGQHCSIGAIGHALGHKMDLDGFVDYSAYDSGNLRQVASFLVHYLPEETQEQNWPSVAWNVIVEWNNEPDRTAEEVVDTMRLAAKDLRNEATP